METRFSLEFNYLKLDLKISFLCLCLFVCSQRYPAEVTDLISEGEIGSGTCGQVFKVRFKKTGHVIAVKVRMHSPQNDSPPIHLNEVLCNKRMHLSFN